MTIRVGVVGLGVGRAHAKAYHASELADLVAICDLNETLLTKYKAMYPQASTYRDYEEMFAEGGLDAVSVALPNNLHAPVTIAALRAGLDVLCEKPMATNVAPAEDMLRAAREAGRKLMIHFNYRFSPQSQFAKRYVDEGHLGQVYYAQTRWLRVRGIPKMGGWFGVKRSSGGGPLIDLGVHRLDLAMWLMGYPRAVSISAVTYDLLGARLAREAGASYDVEDLAAALIRLENGATLNLEVSWAGGTDKREEMLTAVYGTGGAVIQRNADEGYTFEAVALKDVAGVVTEVSPKAYPRETESSFEHFIRCVAEDTPPTACPEHGLQTMRIIDAIYRSAAEGREVQVVQGDL